LNNNNTQTNHIPAPLGKIEPHANMLDTPQDGQLLYKMMTIENLLRSIVGSYMHFTRVDRYKDFLGADQHDGQQLLKDQHSNAVVRFEKNPNSSMADYYNRSRARTYACCFSLENSDFIWNNYAKNSAKGKICLVFGFSKLRVTLNNTLQPGNAMLEYNGKRCSQIFSINYGIVQYVEWQSHQANYPDLPNPIEYTYLKDKRFFEEKEFRISLSAFGLGEFVLHGGTINFPDSLQLDFDLRTAIANGTIQQILYSADCDCGFLYDELHKLDIVPKKGSDLPQEG